MVLINSCMVVFPASLSPNIIFNPSCNFNLKSLNFPKLFKLSSLIVTAIISLSKTFPLFAAGQSA